jgi:hypothetical protein
MELGDLFMMDTWRLVSLLGLKLPLEEECLTSWRRVLIPRWHGHTWFLTWRLMHDSTMLRLRE